MPASKTRFAFVLPALVAAITALLPAAALAQAWPSKPVRLIVPFAPGGTTDIVARVMNERLSKELGGVVVIENRAGGGGAIGADMVAKAAPDGYTLGVATVSTMATLPATNPRNPYDPARDFTPIINLVNVPNVITVNPKNLPVKDMKEFIAQIKRSPGKYSYASSGSGGISHLDGELFKVLTGTFIVHIPYRGSGPALNDTIAGQVDIQLDNLPSSIPHIKAGRLKALAVMSARRLDALPDVPTFAEVGLKEANNMAWYGLVGPHGLPPEIVQKANAAANAALKDPEVLKRFAEGGSIAAGGTPQAFAQTAARELALRKDIVRKQKIVLE